MSTPTPTPRPASAKAAQRRLRLGDLLLREGLVTREQIQKALSRQRILGGLIGTNLLDIGAVPEELLLEILGQQVGTPTVEATMLDNIDPQVLNRLPKDIVKRYQVVPFRIDGGTLLVASTTPHQLGVEEEIKALGGTMARSYVGLEVRIWEALERHYRLRPPLRMERLLKRLNTADPALDTQELPRDMTRETAPLDRLKVPEARPTALDLLASGSQEELLGSDDSLWRGLDLDEVDRKARMDARARNAQEELRQSAEQDAQTFGTSDLVKIVDDGPLRTALLELSHTTRREHVAELMLEGTAHLFERRLLMASRGDRIIGWRGSGTGLVSLRVHTLSFAAHESPVFLSLRNGSAFWLGTLPRAPIHDRVAEIFGGRYPKDCVVIPIRVRDRIVASLYADNLEGSVAGTPIAQLAALSEAAAGALVRYMRERKSQSTP